MKAINLIMLTLALLFFGSNTVCLSFSLTELVAVRSKSDNQKDTAVVNNLVRLGNENLMKKGRLDLIKTYIDSAVIICEKNNFEIPASLHLLIAEYHYFTGDLRSSSEEASMALKKAASAGENKTLAKANILFARYYRRTRFYKESIEYYNNAISIAKKEGIKGLIASCYAGQADLFNEIGDIKAWRQNLELVIETGFAEADTSALELGFSRLGTSFCGDSSTSPRRNFKMADSLLKRSIEISLMRKDTGVLAFSTANLGWNFYLEKMYDTAIYHYEKSLKFSIPNKLYGAAANSLGNLGTIYRDLGENEKSVKYYKKAIDMALKVNDLFNLRWIYQDMSNMYLGQKDTANAYKTYVRFKHYNDLFLTKANSTGLDDARIRYEEDVHRKQVELLSLKLKNNRLLNYGFAGLSLLALVIGYLLYMGSRLKNKRRISEMNRKIAEITQANLRQQMNPHFIFNTLNSIQYYMYQHDKLATNNYLTKFSSLMRKVLDNSQHTSVPLSDELQALNLYLELESIRFKDKFEYSINIDEEIDPLMYKVPTMLIQPYVENSICHGLIPLEGKGYVNIDMKLNENSILCTIEDNGIGREAARDRKQKLNHNHNSLGTQITTSRLELVNELYGTTLHTIYTDLKNENGEPSGTRVELHIPIIL